MPSRWPVHTVVFDLDDTLYAEKDFVHGGFAAVDAWLRANHDTSGFEAEALKLFVAGHRGRIFNEALELLRLQATPELVAAMIEVYRSHRPLLQLFLDAAQVLQWATGAGLAVALITDGFASVQRRKIEALGLDKQIACCVVTDELGGKAFWKPHPAAFLRVMDVHPGIPAGYVYVADNPRKDFIAPRQLGWRSIRIRRAGAEQARYEGAVHENAEVEISSLSDLPKLLVPR